jgi:hypothetical protein
MSESRVVPRCAASARGSLPPERSKHKFTEDSEQAKVRRTVFLPCFSALPVGSSFSDYFLSVSSVTLCFKTPRSFPIRIGPCSTLMILISHLSYFCHFRVFLGSISAPPPPKNLPWTDKSCQIVMFVARTVSDFAERLSAFDNGSSCPN